MRRILPLLPLLMMATSFAGTPRSMHSCTVCHLVRTSEDGKANRPISEICRSCHDGVTAPNHDRSDRELEAGLPAEGAYEHVRLTWQREGRQSMDMDNCVRCHNPHNPNPKHVKRETSDCRKCHQEY